jgi:hypothetical protein
VPLLNYNCNIARFYSVLRLGIRQEHSCGVKQFIHLSPKRVLQRESACSIGAPGAAEIIHA